MYAIRFLAEMVGLYHRIQDDGYRFFFQLPQLLCFFFLLLYVRCYFSSMQRSPGDV
jgi:hypothetical protein